MVRAASLIPLALLLVAVPARAQDRAAEVAVPAAQLDDAIRLLSRQTGASIGFRDPAFAQIPVRAVSGRFTAGQALERMLLQSGLRARRVAPATYLIERLLRPAPQRVVRPAAPRAAPSRPEPEPPAEEIVVTGTKRDVPLSAYPGGVQIIEGARLSAADGLRGTGAIEARVASVVSTHLGPGRNKLFIRGIADSSFVGPTQATVGQYWGNSRITYSAPDPSLKLYDVRSIEVLEGPQGTLYGAGSLGGVVRVVPQAPDLTAAGGNAWAGAQAIQHGRPGIDGGAVLNLPIVEGRLALRALAFGSIEGGYIDDTARGIEDVNEVRTIGGRAALRFEPGDDWSIDINGVGQRIDGEDGQYAERGGDGLSRSSTIAQPYDNEFWLADLVVRKQWGPLELTSSLGYARQYAFERFEGPALLDPANPVLTPETAAAPTAFSQANRIEMITTETRLARRGADGTGWLVGVSLLHNEARANREMGASDAGIALTGVRNEVDEATLYGEATVAPLDALTVTLGGRLTHSRLAGDAEDVVTVLAFRFDPTARADRNETRLLPSAALAWRASDALTLFARYQQGFRPGGIAVRRDFIQRFTGDRVATTEAGARYTGTGFDLSLSASWSVWNDIQADLIDGFGFPTTANVGDGRVLSVGLASRWRPIPGLEIDAALYLNDSKVTDRIVVTLPAATGLDLDERTLDLANFERLPNIADATGRVGFTYSTPLGGGLGLDTSGFARYVGKSTLGVGPILGQLQGDYVDTGLEFRIGTPRRGISVSLTNLLDARGNRFALGSPFQIRDRNQITPLQPRSIRIGVDADF